MSESESIFRVSFHQQGEIWEVYARDVSQGGLFGFVEIEGLLFGQKSELVLDPSEDRVRNEFDGVSRFYLPLHSILRIDQVQEQGTARVAKEKEKPGVVTPFPMPYFKPSGE